QLLDSSSISIKNSSLVNISNWVRTRENEKTVSLQVQHMVDTFERQKEKIKKESRKDFQVEIRTENWDRVFIQKVLEEGNRREVLLEALEENKEERDFRFYTDSSSIGMLIGPALIIS